MNMEIITAIALGIGLSASTGFRVFVPMLVVSVAAHFHIIPLTADFSWLGSWIAIVIFGVATIVEIFAYYIPFIDNILDALTTPIAVVAGTLLMVSVLPLDDTFTRWILGFILGGGASATIQSGSVLSRFSSTKFTAGTANPIISTGENVASFAGSIASLFIPMIVASIFILIAIFLFVKFFEWRRNKLNQKEKFG